MRKSQKEQIKQAKNAYIFPLNKAGSRFSVYLDNQPDREGNLNLEILWPSDSHQGKKSSELLSNQVYYSRINNNLPAYHFHLIGGNYSKKHEIAESLQAINPNIEVLSLSGFTPSTVACHSH